MRELLRSEVSRVSGAYGLHLTAVTLGAASSGMVSSLSNSDFLQSAALGGGVSAVCDIYTLISSPDVGGATRLAQAAFRGLVSGLVFSAITVEKSDERYVKASSMSAGAPAGPEYVAG